MSKRIAILLALFILMTTLIMSGVGSGSQSTENSNQATRTGSTESTKAFGPQVSNVFPADRANNVDPNLFAVAVYFDSPMSTTTLNGTNFYLTPGVSGALVAPDANSDSIYIIGTLAANTTYTATVTTGVKNSLGVAMTNNYTWSFTTGNGNTDQTPPEVIGKTPGSGSSNTSTTNAIQLNFNEDLDQTTVNSGSFVISPQASGNVSYDGGKRAVVFTPLTALSAFTVYTCTVTSNVKDKAGNSLYNNFQWSFTTGAGTVSSGSSSGGGGGGCFLSTIAP